MPLDFRPLIEMGLTHEHLDRFSIEPDEAAFSGISGGRTSALMHVLLPPSVHACFENTGREHPKTYEFLARVEDLTKKPITWLEYTPPPKWGMAPKFAGFKIVNYDTANRTGEPFENLLETLRTFRETKGKGPIVPWVKQRLCTAYMKIRVQKYYAKSLGHEEHTSFVGLRADEPERVAQMKDRDTWAIEHRAPLSDAGITKAMVLRFWAAQKTATGKSADLDLEEYQGNCTGCFLKDESDLTTALMEDETDAAWWLRVQDKYGQMRPNSARSYRALMEETADRMVIREAVARSRNTLQSLYLNANALEQAKEIDSLLKVGPGPGDPFIDHLRFSKAAGEKMNPVPRLNVGTYEALDSRFRPTADDDLDEPAYSDFVNDAIGKALHEGKDFDEVFGTPVEVLRIFHQNGVETGTAIVNAVLKANAEGKLVENARFGEKCNVKGCTNERKNGTFIGEFCAPCWNMITTGNIGPSTNFIADLQADSKIVADGFKIAEQNAQKFKEQHDRLDRLTEQLRAERDRAVGDLVTVRESLVKAIAERDTARDASAKARAEINKAYADAEAAREHLKLAREQYEALRKSAADQRVLDDQAFNDALGTIDAINNQRADFRKLLEEVLGLMDHQGISTTKHRDRIRDALHPSNEPPAVPKREQPGYQNVTSAAVALKPVAGAFVGPGAFDEDFKAKLALGKYTRWAVDLDTETLRLVLWFVGEYTVRGGLHERQLHHWRTVGASKVLCNLATLHVGEKVTFDDCVRLMDGEKNTKSGALEHHSHTFTTVECVRDVIANMILEGHIKDESGRARGSIGYEIQRIPVGDLVKKAGL